MTTDDAPRLITEAETAHLLGMTPWSFSRKASQLEDELGMPRRHPMLKRRDRVASTIGSIKSTRSAGNPRP
jgi:hypothetical protein